MAVVLGTSSGFVTATPTGDPNGTGVTIDGSSVVTKDTSPATAYKITEVGWYRGSGTNAANWEIALYAEAAGVAAGRLFVDNTNSSTSNGWLSVAVNWPISPSTAYWLALQMDAHTGSSTVDSAASGGAGSDVLTGQTTLNDPYGGGAVADADGMYAIYALWVPVPAGAVSFPVTFTPVETGKVAARSAVAFPISLAEVTNGVRTAFARTVAPLTWDALSSGVRVGLGQVALPITFDVLSEGTVEGAGEDFFGIVDSPFSFTAVTSGHLAQLAHPTLDSVDGAWTNELGGADLEGSVDDLTVSDADYIQSEFNPQTSAARLKLEGLSDPNSSGGHVLRWRIAKDAAGGFAVSITATLRQGGGDVLGAGTEIASFTRSDVSEAFTTFEEHLSAGQADAITDYSDLFLELSADVA